MDGDRRDEILQQLSEGVVRFDEEQVIQASRRALDEGINALTAIVEGLSPGMETVGDLFQRKEYFVPEVLMCADALNAGLEILKPHLKEDETATKKGRVVIGTIEGDIHEIGKSLVALMLDISGFEVRDLGVDVSLERFLSEHREKRSDIIAISALMSTTMLRMRDFIVGIKEADPGVLTMVGGAPLTAGIARDFGADGYAEDARGAVIEAKRVLAID
jgi:corrinoid protein of di/trimethylamine methyltransferase